MATEDFTTYTEVDPGSQISVTSSTMTATNLTRNKDTHLYNDEGAGHFGNSLAHDFTLHVDSFDHWAEIGLCWAVSNYVDDFKDWKDNNRQAAIVYLEGAKPTVYLEDCEDASNDSYAASNATYYITVQRTGTTLEVKIYSDSGRTNLLDTLTTSLLSGRAYQYVFACNSYNSNNSDACSFRVQDLDLNEGYPVSPYYYTELLAA